MRCVKGKTSLKTKLSFSAKASASALIGVLLIFQGLVETVEKNDIDGLEIKLQKLDSKNDISEFIGTIRSRLGNDLYVSLSIPARTDLLAKYYDLKQLSKSADLFVLQTAFLGASKNTTFHPSRLSGLWDMQNTVSSTLFCVKNNWFFWK